MRIFDVSPFNYGHRGDEVIWKYFATLSDEQYNILIQDVESYVIAFMDSNTTMKYPEKNW